MLASNNKPQEHDTYVVHIKTRCMNEPYHYVGRCRTEGCNWSGSKGPNWALARIECDNHVSDMMRNDLRKTDG